jgi:spermidine synthase
MGTTFRSSLSWGIDTTVVELAPSVAKDFSFYHDDASKCLANPLGHIVIDDGRRYLSRCGRKFDVIAVDPPPPVEAAGCSLLYSKEFYRLAIAHLNPHGLLQMWYMGSEPSTDQAVIRSMVSEFPYVLTFQSVEGWGMHMVGSQEPIVLPSIATLVARLPAAAQADLVEWNPGETATDVFTKIFTRQVDLSRALTADPEVAVTDDRPFNEYYLLRALDGKSR